MCMHIRTLHLVLLKLQANEQKQNKIKQKNKSRFEFQPTAFCSTTSPAVNRYSADIVALYYLFTSIYLWLHTCGLNVACVKKAKPSLVTSKTLIIMLSEVQSTNCWDDGSLLDLNASDVNVAIKADDGARLRTRTVWKAECGAVC